MQFTKEQEQAIYTNKGNLLVAAGAGSGKTAVLVERIINKVINENVSIDRLLVVTFTNAAASEMKERLAKRLYDELLNNPGLQSQIEILPKASISTIDSFCLKVVKDNFFKLDLDPNFRIGDTGEIELLKLETLEELLEKKYDEDSEDFNRIISQYTSNKSDDNLRALILKIYQYTRSIVNPNKWLNEKAEEFNISNIKESSSNNEFVTNSTYGKYLIQYTEETINSLIQVLQDLYDDISTSELAGKYVDVVLDDLNGLKALNNINHSWDSCLAFISNFSFARASGAKNVPEEVKEEINDVRKFVKGEFSDLSEKVFISSADEIVLDYDNLYSSIKGLINLVKEFSDLFLSKKIEKNILGFSDVEHYALKLLTENNEIADLYKSQFDEILIDEYQDSNEIQENILNSISNGKIFMVGDVKQSIYKFRQAKPELFLEKYNTYKDVTDDYDNNKILLFDNFRSNSNIISQANFVFNHIMSKNIGDIDYNENEFLKFGANYYSKEGENAEFALIETQNQDVDFELEDTVLDSNANLEGRFIAKRIKELVGNIDVYDKSTASYRKAQYRDIAVLLRNSVGRLESFVEEMSNLNIPVYADNTGNYFESTEIQTIISLLRIIDNPIQDIPLVAVLRSQIGGFTTNELSRIRIASRNDGYYNALIKYLNVEDELSAKVKCFLDNLEVWREKSKYKAIWELLWTIYNETGYIDFVSLFPDGVRRRANLNLLLERAERFEKTSFKGLFNFINYIDNLKLTSNDYTESKMIGENENVVRIMSVHKSKGLEFPIVILAGTDKRFNTRDLSDNVLLDEELGFGMDVIDYDSKIVYPNISKQAVSLKSRKESLSEEMRILYVALTRAREKLIVTGLCRDVRKQVQKYSGNFAKYKVSDSGSFMDWIGNTVVNKNREWDVIEVPFADSYTNNESEDFETKVADSISISQEEYEKLYKAIDEQMKWTYLYKASTQIPNKISISELKRRALDEQETSSELIKQRLVPKPEFMEEDVISGASFGTIVHGVLQKIDFKAYSKEYLEKIINDFSNDERIKKSVSRKIEKFSTSELFKSVSLSNRVYKETPFNLNIKASEVYNIDTDDYIMLQGIIDLYYFDENGDLVLVDYKTDNVEKEQDLIDRYNIQLNLYKRALEEILNVKVAKTVIYSFKFEKEIALA